MVFEKKQLSKALVIALVVACAVAFMPLLNGSVFAADKPAKVKIKSAKQVTNTMNVKVTWAKAKNAKKYQVKVGKKTYTSKKNNYTVKNLAAGTYKIKVRGVNGKTKGKWSKAKKVVVADKAAAAVVITGTANVGATLTANVTNAAGEALTEGVAYQWYRVNTFTGVVAEISGATEATYKVAASDYDAVAKYTLFVKATAGGKTVESTPTTIVTDARTVGNAVIEIQDDHAAPQLGDKLTAKVYDTVNEEVPNAELNYQWYADGVAINGATAKDYTVTEKRYVGTVISVVAEAKKTSTKYTGSATSPATAPVIESTVPTGVEIVTEGNAPYVGETINTAFTPVGSADDKATYQWYRCASASAVGSAISGATSASYTATASDKGSYLKVVVTLSDEAKTALPAAYTKGAVGEKLVGATIALASNNEYDTEVYTTSDKATATVKNSEKANITNNFEFAWYLDSVADENQVHSTPYIPAAKKHEGDTYNGAELNLGGNFYLEKATTKTDIVGHKLIAVASTSSDYAYQGSVTSAASAAVQTQLDMTAGVITGDTGDDVYMATKTTLTVDPKIQEKATATYAWARKAKGTTTWRALSETGTSYALTADDEGYFTYKVTVTGTGDYYGEKTIETAELHVVANDPAQTITVKPTITGGTEAMIGGAKETVVQPGATLTAGVDVAAAEKYVKEYTWTYTEDGAEPVVKKENTFTIPATATAAKNAAVSLAVTFKVTDFTPDTAATATVQDAIKGLTLTNPGASIEATTEKPGHDGVAYPNVGETLVATMTAGPGTGAEYQWYADGVKIETADATDDADFTLTEDEYGKAITVTVKGGEGFIGSTATSEASGKVDAVGALVIKAGAEGHEATIANPDKYQTVVGTRLTAYVQEYVYDKGVPTAVANEYFDTLVGVTWTVAKFTSTDASYTAITDDVGSTIKCEATGVTAAEDGALVWDNGLEIVEDKDYVAVSNMQKVDPVTSDDYPVATQTYYYYNNNQTGWQYSQPNQLAAGSKVSAGITYYTGFEKRTDRNQWRVTGNPVVLNNTWYTIGSNDRFSSVGNLNRINSTTDYYKINENVNPNALGWYEVQSGKYVLTADTSINATNINKAYYVEK